jgi:hypothetical protein
LTNAWLLFAVTHGVSRTCSDGFGHAGRGPPGGVGSSQQSDQDPGNFAIAAHGFNNLNEENAMNTTIRVLFVTAAVATLSFVALPKKVHAQASGFQDAGAKIRGDIYWPGRASTHYVESARNYAQQVQSYVAKAPQPDPSVVKDIKTELGRYLDEAQKHLATMKKDLASDKEAVAGIEGIEKGLATAVEHNKAMIACCENQKFDKIATMTCCTDLVKQLDKVHADHVALMKKLSQKYSATAK